jgi:hypothetical protein
METAIKPEIGMGATVSYAADSHAMTIIEVSQNGKTVIVQRDSAKATGESMSNTWITTPNPQGATQEFTLRQNGRYVAAGESMKNGTKLHIGSRHEYYSYEF